MLEFLLRNKRKKKQFLIYGYDKMPMEIEARYEEDEYTKENYSEVYHKETK